EYLNLKEEEEEEEERKARDSQEKASNDNDGTALLNGRDSGNNVNNASVDMTRPNNGNATIDEVEKRYLLCLLCYARCLRKNKELKKSESNLTRLLEIWPNHYGAHVEYGLCLFEMQRFEEARFHYLEAIRIDEKDHTAYRHYGTLCFIAREYVQALWSWENCFALMTCARGTRYIDCLENALQNTGTRKDFASLLARYGWCVFHVQKNMALARQCYEMALSYDDNNTLALKCLGILLHREYGDSKTALQHLERVMKLDPNSAVAIAWYADCLRCAKSISISNRLEQVAMLWNKALTMQPDLLKANALQIAYEEFTVEYRVYRSMRSVFVFLLSLSSFQYLHRSKRNNKQWLRDTVKLPEYLPHFQCCGYSDIRMATYIDEQTLIDEVKILKRPHRMVFLKKASELRDEMLAFENWLKKLHCERYLSKFENIGVFTVLDALSVIRSKEDLKEICENDAQAQFLLWLIVFSMNKNNEKKTIHFFLLFVFVIGLVKKMYKQNLAYKDFIQK
ncbi:hypothetical protein RFI_05407, partial [Reticulomyxa filosa]